jgi:hypothetical protein
MTLTSHKFDNLLQLVQRNRDEVDRVMAVTGIRLRIAIRWTTALIKVQSKSSQMYVQITQQLGALYTGIEKLVQGKLSTQLVPIHDMQSAINRIQCELIEHHPEMKLLHQLLVRIMTFITLHMRT